MGDAIVKYGDLPGLDKSESSALEELKGRISSRLSNAARGRDYYDVEYPSTLFMRTYLTSRAREALAEWAAEGGWGVEFCEDEGRTFVRLTPLSKD